VVAAAVDGIDAIEELVDSFQASPDYLTPTRIRDEFFDRIADLLVIHAIGTVAPAAIPVGALVGLFEFRHLPADRRRRRLTFDLCSTRSALDRSVDHVAPTTHGCRCPCACPSPPFLHPDSVVFRHGFSISPMTADNGLRRSPMQPDQRKHS
jgi:hypothetical protein